MSKNDVLLGIPGYSIQVTRKNIKNMYLRVKDANGTISISAPYDMSNERIEAFVKSREDWIENALERLRQLEKQRQETPVMVPFMERKLRQELRKQLEQLVGKWEPVMGVKASGFTIKKMKTRWGSCNVKTHHLNFNLALALEEKKCVEYVVVHELTHLLEPSHNARFWQLMEYYLPGSRQLRKQLSDRASISML